jgi:short-subunit dehydrogenase
MSRKKTALVTGAAGDIGFEVASRLRQQGYDLILADVNQDGLERVAASLPGSRLVTVDLTDRKTMSAWTAEIRSGDTHLDVAFINAGVIVPGDVLALSEEQIDLQLEVNLRSALILIKACAHNMSANGSGHIVSTVSIGGILALKGSATYAATKFGLRGFMNGLRDELDTAKVFVSGLYPAGVDTRMLRHEALSHGSPLNFVNTPQTVAAVADAFERALIKRQLEIYVPYMDGLFARLMALFPWLIRLLYPLLELLGERGRKRYLQRHKLI